MAIEPDDSEYGCQTVTGAAWPCVNEDALGGAAESYRSLASTLRNEVIPAAQKQMMQLSDTWEGAGSQAALDEASAIISKHEANASAADVAAANLAKMEAAVVKTKNAANSTAEDVQRDSEKLNNTDLRGEVRADRIANRLASGLADNIKDVSANTRELAGNLNTPLGTPGANGRVPTAPPPEILTAPTGQETQFLAPVNNPTPPPPAAVASRTGQEAQFFAPVNNPAPRDTAVAATPHGQESESISPAEAPGASPGLVDPLLQMGPPRPHPPHPRRPPQAGA